METVTLLYEDYQKELAEDFKNTFLKRASDTDSSRSNDAVIDEVTDMLSTNIAVYTEKLLRQWGFSSGGEGGSGGGDVTVTLDDLLQKYLEDNYVTIKGDQEVYGEKDFRKGIRIAGRRLYWDESNDALVIEGAAYTTRWLSAYGMSPGGGGAGSGGAAAMYQLIDVSPNDTKDAVLGAEKDYVLTFDGNFWRGMPNKGGLSSLVYGFESLGGTFDNNDNTATFNAFTINEIWKLASSGLTNVTVTGSGNAVTDVTKGSDGRSLTFTKGNMFASKSEFDALNTKFNDFLTGSDADDIINKWSELEVFLQGMKESDNLAVILQSKMDKSAFNKLFSALDSDGNEIDPSDGTKTVAAIRANFGFWGVDYVSAKGVSKGSGGTGGASALYQLVDVLANDTGDGVDGAVAGKALVFDGTHWKAADAGLNESQLSAFLSLNGYLTQTAADGRYVTSARKVIAGTGLSGGGSLTSDVTLSLGTSGVVAGTYTKVMVDVYGRVTSGTSLSATDIPSLDWSKITTGKPTTLAGYGITDAYSKTEADGKYVTIATAQTISGAKTFSAVTKTASVLPSADANSELGGTANRWNNIYSVNGTFSQNVTAKLLSASETLQIGDAYLKWDSTNNAVYVIKKDGTTPVGFYSTDWLSAKGVSMSGVQTGTLADLTDVEITNPTNGQALKYDAISQKWVNGTIDSFNVNQMWTELTKADSSKVIDASHIPTSVLDNRWVKKAGDTMTGTLTSASTTGSIIFKGLENCDITNIYTNNGTLYSDTNLAIRNGLRFNWYDTYWYIGNLRGAGTNSSGFGIANESNKLCLQVTPDYTTAPVFRSTVGTGTQPYQCSSTTLNTNLNADLLDGYHQTAFTSIIGRRTLYTSGTAPYNYIYLFRIANSFGYSTLRVDIDIKTRYHRAILYVDIVSGQYAYGDNGTSVYISKFQVNGQSARLWYKITKQTSGYNYIDFYYQSGAWNLGSFDIVSRSSNGALVFEPKSTNMDNLPSGCTEVGNTVFDGSITGNAATASRLQTARNINGTTFDGTANITTSYWGTTRTFYTNSHDSYRVSSGVNVNGSGNVTLLLPNSIRCSDWFRSTGNTGWYHENYGGGWYMTDSSYIRNYNSKRLRIQTDTYDTIQLVRTSGSGGSSIAFYNGGGTFRGQFGMNATSWFTFDTGTATANQNVVEISPAGGIHSKAEITAKASGSDIRLKKDIQNYNAMDIINKFRSVKYHWNDVAKANSEVYNNDYDQFGLIAQDLIAGGFKQWVRDVFHDYYTVTYERLIPVVWKGLQEVDDEVTKLKREVARLNKRVKELEKSLCA